jgi:hypothetical protein
MAKVFDCIYGGPGTAKSESCARLIEHVYKTTGQVARVVVGDGSALTYEHLVEAGIAEICDFGTRPWPQDTLQKLSSGYWPNPNTGELVPLGFQIVDQNQVIWQNDLTNVGVYIFEGMSVAGAYIMGNVQGGLAERSGRGEKIGQDSPIRIVEGEVDPKTGKVTSGPGTSFGGNPPSHYNVAQRTILECLQRSKALPVDYCLWTAHEADNNPEKDLNKESLVGPEVVGKALTGSIQRNFNNTLHCVVASRKAKAKEVDKATQRTFDELVNEYRIYTQDHYSASGSTTVRFKACTRGGSVDFPQYFVSKEPGDALLTYYQTLSNMRKDRAAMLTAAVVPLGGGA